MAWHQIPNSPMRLDGDYINMLNKYGTMQDNSTAYQFQRGGFVNDMFLTDQYEGNGLFAKIIDIPAEESVKHGFSLGLKEKCEAETYITQILEYLEFEEIAAQAVKWSRLFGGALAVMLIDDGRGIEEPLDWKNIKGIEEIRLYERAIVYPDYSSMYRYVPDDTGRSRRLSRRYGVPERYHVNSIYEQFWVHESRCLIFRNGKLPERTMQAYYRMWGLPEYIRIRNALRKTMTSHSTSVKMLERAVQAIYSMKGLADLVAGPGGKDLMIERLQAIDLARNILNSIAIDAEGESYEFKTFTLTGVKEVIEGTYNMLSAVSSIPQTKLFGRSPDGMNSTGHGDMENFYGYVGGIQNLQLKPNLQILLDIIIRAGMAQGEIEEEPKIKLIFNPLWSMSEDEKADIEQKKANTQKTKADTAKIYVEMGVLDPSEVRKGLAQEDEFNIEELLDGLEDETDLWGESDFYETDTKNSLTLPALYGTIIHNDANEGWKTINGTPVPVGENGELKGEVGDKIMMSSKSIDEYNTALRGTRTVDGKEVKGISKHCHKRAAERGFSPERIMDVLSNANITYPGNTEGSTTYNFKGNRVILGADGNVITVIGGGEDGSFIGG